MDNNYYDKEFAAAKQRIYNYIDRGCRTEIEWIMEVYEQTGILYYQSPEEDMRGIDYIPDGKYWFEKGISDKRNRE